jgi:hypothetical protein
MLVDEYVLRSRKRSLRVDEHVATVRLGAQEGSPKNQNIISASGYAISVFGTRGKTQNYIPASAYAISVFGTRGKTQDHIPASAYAISVLPLGAKRKSTYLPADIQFQFLALEAKRKITYPSADCKCGAYQVANLRSFRAQIQLFLGPSSPLPTLGGHLRNQYTLVYDQSLPS